MAEKTNKARAFAFVIYPDSWQTWERDLSSLHMPIIVSPVHDRDVWTEEDEKENPEHKAGTLKKPHRHAIISWGNATTLRHALDTLKPFGVSYLELVNSYQGYCRYLCHLDDPDKAAYDIADVICLGGGVPDFTKKMTDSELFDQRDEIMQLCDENGVLEYADLVDYVRLHRPDWRQDVYNHTIFWRGFFSSKRHRLKH